MFQSILLVDDHAAIVEGLRQVLGTRHPGARCRTATSLNDAKWLLSREQPDLIILDLAIGNESGLDLMQVIRTQAPDARVVIYTMHSEDQFGLVALRAGAHGYLTKDRPLGDLMEAIERVGTGRRYISPQLAEALAEALAGESAASEARHLSVRETQTLRMLAEGKAPKEIAGELGVSVKTVSTYRARILDKLGLTTTADLIRYAVAQDMFRPRSASPSCESERSPRNR
jgi:DNA-binding NarL/FixJ family response regulator